jgi:hypothetical protein
MKLFKFNSIFIIVLLLVAGFSIVTVLAMKSNSSKALTNDSSVLSTEDSIPQDKSSISGDSSPADTSVAVDSETTSETADTSETVTSVLNLNDTFLSCHADPADVDAQSGATVDESIYGKNLSLIPTEVLINKASVSGNNQNAEFMGIVIDFKPMIIAIGSNKETTVTFDLTAFKYADGQYTIMDTATQEVLTTFTGSNGVQEVRFNAQKSGGYSIIKDNYTLGIIEVVDNLDSADLEDIRKKYIY